MTGSFLLAMLPASSYIRDHPVLPVFLGTGVLGGYTTLSAYADQSRALFAAGSSAPAFAYLAGTLLCCVAAVRLAHLLSSAEAQRRVRGRGEQRMTPLLVTVGAAVGAVLRYLAGHYLDGELHRGTLLVNVVGSFLLGVFAGKEDLAEARRTRWSRSPRRCSRRTPGSRSAADRLNVGGGRQTPCP